MYKELYFQILLRLIKFSGQKFMGNKFLISIELILYGNLIYEILNCFEVTRFDKNDKTLLSKVEDPIALNDVENPIINVEGLGETTENLMNEYYGS